MPLTPTRQGRGRNKTAFEGNVLERTQCFGFGNTVCAAMATNLRRIYYYVVL